MCVIDGKKVVVGFSVGYAQNELCLGEAFAGFAEAAFRFAVGVFKWTWYESD